MITTLSLEILRNIFQSKDDGFNGQASAASKQIDVKMESKEINQMLITYISSADTLYLLVSNSHHPAT